MVTREALQFSMALGNSLGDEWGWVFGAIDALVMNQALDFKSEIITGDMFGLVVLTM